MTSNLLQWAESLGDLVSVTENGELLVKAPIRISGSVSGYAELQANPLSGDIQYVLPANDGLTGEVLATNGFGALYWTPAAGVASHGALTGLDEDDHLHYHTDARGDARYYTQSQLDAGVIDGRYFTQSEFIGTSAGAQDFGKPIVLDIEGKIDATMINAADISHQALGGAGTNTHATIDTHLADSTVHFTESSIDHDNITGAGTNTHSQLDSHVGDATIHFTIDNVVHGGLSGLTNDDHPQYALLAGRPTQMLVLTQLELEGATSGSIYLEAAAASDGATYTWPAADGTANQVLTTDGLGGLSWTTPAGNGGSLDDYAYLPGRAGGQTLIGGTAATDGLWFQTTAGTGAAGSEFRWLVGTNGDTVAMRILNDTKVAFNRTIADPFCQLEVESDFNAPALGLRPKSGMFNFDYLQLRIYGHVAQADRWAGIQMANDGGTNLNALEFLTNPQTAPIVRMKIDPHGNLGLNTQTFDASARGVMSIANASAIPAAGTSGQTYLYSRDEVAVSHLFSMDGAGTEKQLSSHMDVDQLAELGIEVHPDDMLPEVERSRNVFIGVERIVYRSPYKNDSPQVVQRILPDEDLREWDLVQKQIAAAKQAMHDAWLSRKMNHDDSVEPFTEREPELHKIEPVPKIIQRGLEIRKRKK